eukprot:TRINITY_DN12312_c0_g1_i14.p4 TRINITY_DN12312_c0_g1~~TRINITY_DN12312_c0_g1_i14.p4  ORF type:complete len:105 (-),score=2.57 TRINITY_DN12312_c0_g1_i14:2138-2452(-)
MKNPEYWGSSSFSRTCVNQGNASTPFDVFSICNHCLLAIHWLRFAPFQSMSMTCHCAVQFASTRPELLQIIAIVELHEVQLVVSSTIDSNNRTFPLPMTADSSE